MEYEQPKGIKKIVENYWYHYKWHTLITAFFVAVIIICTTQCMMRENPDYRVLLYVNQTVSDNQSETLENFLEQWAVDVNRDGEISVANSNVSYSKTKTTQDIRTANATKILGEIGTCDCLLYVVDEEAFNYYMQEDNMELFENIGLPDKDGCAWNWKGSSLQKSVCEAYRYPENLYFCVRRVSGTTADSENNLEKQTQAKEFLKRVIADNK